MSSTFSVTGRVTTMEGEALPGVVVSADGEAIENTITTVTNAEGLFDLRDLPPPGQYLLSAQLAGFLDWKKPIVVQPDVPFIANITMYPE
jgi:hypothetical protein